MGNIFPIPCACGNPFANHYWDCTAVHAKNIYELEDNLQALKTATQELSVLRDDLMRRLVIQEGHQMKPLKQVQDWLSTVEAKILEVDELIRDGPLETEKLCLGGRCSKNCRSSYIYGKRVAKELEDVDDLKRKGDFKEIVERARPAPVVEMHCDPRVLGMESMLDKVWNCLVQEEVGIVGIYGMVGIGKTTLLTQVNNKFVSTPHDFEVVIWLVVSKDCRLEKLQEQIAKRIGLSYDQQWNNKRFDQKAADIFKVLQKMKFALLLDDIWDRVELKKIGIPLPNRQNKSKIIFTTRSAAVCGNMEAEIRIKMQPLGSEKAWELFRRVVREDTLADPRVRLIAEEIARKCFGSPLALINIGRTMAFKGTREEWMDALHMLGESASEFEGTGVVFPSFKFSYDNLPNEEIKSCFLYCCLFPEDSKILKNNLIEYWICEKFWKNIDDNQEDAFNKGYRIIGTLVDACLLEEEGEYIKMHGMIRDMTVSLAGIVEMEKESYLVQANAHLTEAPVKQRWRRARRISLMENDIRDLTEVPSCPHLLTLLLCYNQNLSMITSGFFQYMEALTVLDLSNSCIEEVPREISNLISLQYLNLSHTWIEQLPLELKMLMRLKCLNLEYDHQLRMISKQVISSMLSLEVLRMFRCGFSLQEEEDNLISATKMDIDGLQRLEHLKLLSITITCVKALQSFFSTCRLPSCTQALSLEVFWGSESLNISPLPAMKHLVTLEIHHAQHLKQLKVDFMIEGSFNCLREVSVGNCSSLQELTWLILAQNLQILRVASCGRMEEIISSGKLGAIQNADKSPFEKLEVLELESLPELRSIYWEALPFHYLKKIKVLDCQLLKKLPLNSDCANGDGLIIEGEEDWWAQVEWENNAFLSCFRQTVY